jgi:hypothetical protein
MRSTYLVVGVVGLLILAAACGGDDKAPTVPDADRGGSAGKSTGGKSTGGKSTGGSVSAGGEGGANDTAGTTSGGKAGSGGSGGSGGTLTDGVAGAGGADPGTPPTVTIVSPEAVTDPLGGKVLVADDVDVVCKVVKGVGGDADPVDPTSVKIAVLNAAGAVVSEKSAGLTVDNQYAATIPLTAVASGKISLRCTAESTSNAIGTAARNTLADRGPKLTLTAPLAGAKLALKDAVKFSFTAEPAPLTVTGDTQADLASVSLKINGVTITAPPTGSPNAYEALVNFNDFVTKPNGNTSVTLTATNKRAPTAAIAIANSTVFVDGTGPVITVKTPHSSDLVGGFVTVDFTVTDTGTGVDADSVTVTAV